METVLGIVDRLANLSAEATTQDVKTLKQQLDGAVQALKTANQALCAEQASAQVFADGGLAKPVDSLPDDAPLGEASDQIQTAVSCIKSALDQANATLKCGK